MRLVSILELLNVDVLSFESIGNSGVAYPSNLWWLVLSGIMKLFRFEDVGELL